MCSVDYHRDYELNDFLIVLRFYGYGRMSTTGQLIIRV